MTRSSFEGASDECPHLPPKVPETYSPPDVSNPALCKLVDRRCTLDERVPANNTSLVPEVKDAHDLEVLITVLSDPTEQDTVRNEVANLLHRSGFAGLEDTLLKVLENPDEEARFRGWAVQHLSGLVTTGQYRGDRQQLTERLHQWLNDRHMEVRREALMALVRQNDPKAMEAVVQWLQAEGPEADRMRDLAIHFVQDKNMREHIPTIRPYARSTNDVIRIAAIVALSEWGDEESRPAMEEAAKSTVVRVQRCGQVALKRLDSAKSAKSNATPAD